MNIYTSTTLKTFLENDEIK